MKLKHLALVALLFATGTANAIIKNQPPASGGGGGTGTVTSVNATAVAPLCVSGGPITISGTLTFTWCGSEPANEFLATPNGTTGAVSLRAIVAADLPAGTGTITNITSSNLTVTGGTGPTADIEIPVGGVNDTLGALANKPSVGLVAVANLTLSGAQTIDGVAGTAGTTLVLATAQSTGSQNGPWVMQTGAWTRPTWYPSGGTTQAFQFITELVRLGTVYQGSVWRMSTAGAVTIDTTATSWGITPQVLNSTTVSGILGVTNGGNGLATATLGDLRYGSGTNTLAALPGNTTTTPNFLAQTGTGSASAAPVWTALTPGTSSAVDVQTFCASGCTTTGSGTWTKPAGTPKTTRIILLGGGGGGGSGAQVTLGTAESGGGGGGGAVAYEFTYPTASLNSTETVTVGAGGAAGAATSGNGPGNRGSQGGSSSFGTTPYVTAFGGGGGGPGASGANSGGGGGGGIFSAGVNSTGASGGNGGGGAGSGGGGSGTNGNAGQGYPGAGGGGDALGAAGSQGGFSSGPGGVGGGAGGGLSATTAFIGGVGIFTPNALNDPAGGTVPGGIGGSGTNGTGWGAGSSAGGGGGNTAGAGGAGGVGGYGGGGGGGGASAGAASGAGGVGGPGLVVVITSF